MALLGGRSLLIFSLAFLQLNGALASTMNQKSLGLVKTEKFMGDLKKQVNEQDKKIVDLKSFLQDIEGKLGKGGRNYSETIKKINVLDHEMLTLGKKIEVQKIEINQNFDVIKETFKDLVLSSIDTHQEMKDLYEIKVYSAYLQSRLEMLTDQLETNKSHGLVLDKFREELEHYRSVEESLNNYLTDLETKKKIGSESYHSELQKRREVIEEWERSQLAHSLLTPKQEILSFGTLKQGSISIPLEIFEKVLPNKKGVTFEFAKDTILKSVAEGVVVYSGILSNYGNVLMIDHGNDMRTVFLGDFVAKVEKGKNVVKGETLADSRVPRGKSYGSLYFEIRKKNLALNTLNFIDKKYWSSRL